MATLVRRYGRVLVVLVMGLGLVIAGGIVVSRYSSGLSVSSESPPEGEPATGDLNARIANLLASGRDPNDRELSGDFPIADFLQGREEIIFRNIMAEKAGTFEALQAQSRLVNVLTQLDRPSQARAELGDMVAAHANQERLPHALSDMVRDAQRQGTSAALGSALADALARHPSDAGSLWLKMAVAENYVYTGADDQVGPAVERIVNEHVEDPNAAEAVVQVAWRYRLTGKPDLAQVYYELALQQWPDNPRAIYHQRGLVYALLERGDETGAWAAVNDLLDKYADDANVTEMIIHMARTYHKQGYLEQTQSLFEYVVQHYPDAPQALTAQHELVLLHIKNGDNAAIEQGITGLINNYADEESYAKDVYRVARHLEQAGRPSQALYEAILAHGLEKTDSLSTQLHVAIAQAALGDSAGCAATRTLLLNHFSNDEKLGSALSTLGEAVYFQGQMAEKQEDRQTSVGLFREAIAEWEALIERFPEDKEVPRAHLCLANTYQHLGQIRKALTHYEAIAWDWPDSEHAWHAQFMIGQCYEQLALRGLESRNKVAVKIRNAYRAVVEVYPHSQATQAAAQGLQRWQKL